MLTLTCGYTSVPASTTHVYVASTVNCAQIQLVNNDTAYGSFPAGANFTPGDPVVLIVFLQVTGPKASFTFNWTGGGTAVSYTVNKSDFYVSQIPDGMT